MKSQVKSLYSALIGAAVVTSALFAAPMAHADQIVGFKIDLPGLAPVITNINELKFDGSSFVVNTFAPSTPAHPNPAFGDAFTFTDNGVYLFSSKNGGSLNPFLNGGQLTGNYTGGTGYGTLGGSIYFNGDGKFDLYYNPTYVYGDTAPGSRYGADAGILIASFKQVAGLGGLINPDGTVVANGQLQLSFTADYLAPSTWFASTGTPLPVGSTLSFVTANASQDLTNNCPSGTCNPDPVLIAALAGSTPNANALPYQFLVSNGAQFKLASEVPEPGTVALLGLGLLGFTVMRRKSA